ncbi:MAG: hypothetical protein ACXVRK_02460 [Gaiellaceae bacterium]
MIGEGDTNETVAGPAGAAGSGVGVAAVPDTSRNELRDTARNELRDTATAAGDESPACETSQRPTASGASVLVVTEADAVAGAGDVAAGGEVVEAGDVV